MRSFLLFLGLFAAGFAVIAVASYPAYSLLAPHYDVAFHRVGTRLGMLVLLVGFVLASRRLQLADRASLGYGLPRSAFLREATIGLALGVATLLPVVAIMVLLDLRTLRAGVVLDLQLLRSLLL